MLGKKNEIEVIKKAYPKGTRIRLISMSDDPRPIAPETCGTVDAVDDIGTIHVKWDNGRTLGLCLGIDQFEKIS